METLVRDHAATIDLDIEDRELRVGLAEALTERPDLRFSEHDAPAVIITDRPGRLSNIPVLLLGRRELADGRFTAILDPELDPHLILSVARVIAGGMSVAGFSDDHDAIPHPRATLSPRERQVLDLLVDGASNKVVARRLGISVHTAKFHVAAVIAKLGATNRSDAVAIAFRDGYLAL